MKSAYAISAVVVATSSVNPRKPGTVGHLSYGLILAAGGAMSYGEYIKQGGRKEDFDWDSARGWAKFEGETAAEAHDRTPKASRAGVKQVAVMAAPVAPVVEVAARPEATPAEIMAAEVDAYAEAKERKAAARKAKKAA